MVDDTDWSLISFEPRAKAVSAALATPLPKGTCPKCGKRVGKGIHFHMKACDRDDTRDA